MIKAIRIGENRFHVYLGATDNYNGYVKNIGAANKEAAISQFKQAMKLTWLNDFITVNCFLEYYELEPYTDFVTHLFEELSTHRAYTWMKDHPSLSSPSS